MIFIYKNSFNLNYLKKSQEEFEENNKFDKLFQKNQSVKTLKKSIIKDFHTKLEKLIHGAI